MIKKIAIIGGGAAAMMAADVLSQQHEVAIYEKGKTLGRKFLVAGNGGFNLTTSDTGHTLLQQYRPPDFLAKAIKEFDSTATRDWLAAMDIPTFVGTSGRVFPEKGIKPIHVLDKIRAKLLSQNVKIHLRHEFLSFATNQGIVIKNETETFTLKADSYVFALGGASWSVTGSDGSWLPAFEKIAVPTLPFQSSNCGVNIAWTKHILQHHTGKPLKNIAITVNTKTIKGEALITEYGLEGNAVYPLIFELRKVLSINKNDYICLDFKPHNTFNQIITKLSLSEVQPKNYAKVLNLSTAELAILKAFTSKAIFTDVAAFAKNVKALMIPVQSLRPIEESISTVGGIDLVAVDEHFALRNRADTFVIGEMLDWDAPTGGYLLQACFAMGNYVGKFLMHDD